jgi:hypothetical protein
MWTGEARLKGLAAWLGAEVDEKAAKVQQQKSKGATTPGFL